tara:strand:+ start:46 stop:621 length:576 start_codon:yes stop_codon:yes gene_type:complete
MNTEGKYIAKKTINHNTKSDEWVQISKPRQNNKKNSYSYEDNLKKKLERKKKNYLYKINRNKKELEKYVAENSVFIKNRLAEGYIIINQELKNEINNKLDNLEIKLDLINSCDNLREFLVLRIDVKEIIEFINLKINKHNFTQLVLDNQISNKDEEVINKIKNKVNVPKKVTPKVWKKIEPGLSFADILKK